ncbi:MAG: class I SAM-dependent methyltransferase [Magnetococcales bacterium]|nr:class I SAM-dependent methyltransferase [Magnetococcales bacterium]
MSQISTVDASGSLATLPATSKDYLPSVNIHQDLLVPRYLEQTYWWAYLHPVGVRFFERQWIVNTILWGNFSRLRDAALDELGESISGRTLQVACVYGDFTPMVGARLGSDAHLDVVDVAPVQLENLTRKIGSPDNIRLHHMDSTNLQFQEGSFDNVVVFFLLHEQPAGARARTIQEALRVVKPGGKVVFVDYHAPWIFNPFRYAMIPILSLLEPFALDLWKREILDWVPKALAPSELRKETYFGGLYQKVVMIR